MSPEKLLIGVMFVGVLCLTSLIAQCSQNQAKCKEEAIKNNVPAEQIRNLCAA